MRSLPKDRIISSMHTISTLLTQHISVESALAAIAQEISHAFGMTRLIIFFVDKFCDHFVREAHRFSLTQQGFII